jgi:hypothetical protein
MCPLLALDISSREEEKKTSTEMGFTEGDVKITETTEYMIPSLNRQYLELTYRRICYKKIVRSLVQPSSEVQNLEADQYQIRRLTAFSALERWPQTTASVPTQCEKGASAESSLLLHILCQLRILPAMHHTPRPLLRHQPRYNFQSNVTESRGRTPSSGRTETSKNPTWENFEFITTSLFTYKSSNNKIKGLGSVEHVLGNFL